MDEETGEQQPPAPEPEKGFNPTPYIISLKGKPYMPVAPRIAMFRDACPISEGYGIRTEQVGGSREEKFATYRAYITRWVDGVETILACGTKTEDIAGFGDFAEKAETGSIGRALAAAGFGTIMALEFDEGTERLVDAPVTHSAPTPGGSHPRATAAPPPAGSPGDNTCVVCGKLVPANRVSRCHAEAKPITHPVCESKGTA